MKGIVIALLCLIASAGAQPRFEEHFTGTTLRIDLYHVGDATAEFYTLHRLREEGSWAGNRKNLIDPFGLGRNTITVRDPKTGDLLYSRGFDTYFGEYQTTEQAKHVRRTFQETVLIPFPKHPVSVTMEVRDRKRVSAPVWNAEVDPGDDHILRETPGRGGRIFPLAHGGEPGGCVDLVVVAEGYSPHEEEKFEHDAKGLADTLFSLEPYRRMRGRFNITGIFIPSPESGVDEPRQGSYRSTALGFSFNSLDSDRYLLTEEHHALRDVAGQVPYDLAVVLVNKKRYGGGGIYNFFAVCTSDGAMQDFVFHHEFAHAFAALADEYYTSGVAYDSFFPEGVEPAEPNLTALLDPGKLKWNDLVTPGLPIPTEWGQATFDSLSLARSAVEEEKATALKKMKETGAPVAELTKRGEEYDARARRIGGELSAFIAHHPLRGKVGAFQGGGYRAKGLYRPTVNSIMHVFNPADRAFYPVNERGVERMIRWICGEDVRANN
jgi:hypothetical protein